MANKATAKRFALTRKLTTCAILSALSVVLLAVGTFIETLDLSAAAFASMIIFLAVIEFDPINHPDGKVDRSLKFGGKYPYLIYGVTSALGLILLPNKFPALVYCFFLGYYPIVKAYFERLDYRFAWALKLSLFNSALLLTYFVSTAILKVPFLGPEATFWGFFALANVTFVVYDIAISRVIVTYIVKWRKRLKLFKW